MTKETYISREDGLKIKRQELLCLIQNNIINTVNIRVSDYVCSSDPAPEFLSEVLLALSENSSVHNFSLKLLGFDFELDSTFDALEKLLKQNTSLKQLSIHDFWIASIPKAERFYNSLQQGLEQNNSLTSFHYSSNYGSRYAKLHKAVIQVNNWFANRNVFNTLLMINKFSEESQLYLMPRELMYLLFGFLKQQLNIGLLPYEVDSDITIGNPSVIRTIDDIFKTKYIAEANQRKKNLTM